MEEEEASRGRTVLCAQEALDLLNCVTESPYDQPKCTLLLNSLRDCVLNKKVKKFSLADQNQQKAHLNSKKESEVLVIGPKPAESRSD